MRRLTCIPSIRPWLLTFLAAILALPAVASAQGEGEGPIPGAYQRRFPFGPPEARLVEKNAEKLGVNAETVAKIKKIADEASAKDEKQREEMRAAWDEMHELLEQPLPDEKALLAQSGKIADLSAELQKRRVLTSYRVRALLTEPQREKFMELRRTPQAQIPRPAGPPAHKKPRRVPAAKKQSPPAE